MHVDVVEDEAAAVQVDDDPGVRVGRTVEPAGHAVGVDVRDLGDVLAGLLGCQRRASARAASMS